MPPVFELDLQPGQKLNERVFNELTGYQLVIVLTNSLEVEYPHKQEEKAVYDEVCRALFRRSYVGLLKGGAKELFQHHQEL